MGLKHFIWILFCFLSFVQYGIAAEKPFRRALIISGGGITPGVSLGIIAAAQKSGLNPDLIIATCGSAMSAAIYHRDSNSQNSKDFLLSKEFFKAVRQFKVTQSDALSLKKGFDQLTQLPSSVLPDFFKTSLLVGPDNLQNAIINNQFKSHSPDPKILVVAAKTLFKPKDVLQQYSWERFVFTYFTDQQTAVYLKNYQPKLVQKFPNSYFADRVEVITDVATDEAARGSIADPFLLAPGRIGDDYYFTGATDLYPIELAQDLADEVYSTYPDGFFDEFQDRVLKISFGYSGNLRIAEVVQNKNIKWIDVSGRNQLKLDPELKWIRFDPWPQFFEIVDRIPSDFITFKSEMLKQWNFGYDRMLEAARAYQGSASLNLREPISNRLYPHFTCLNANIWKTRMNTYCKYDYWPSCNRKEALKKWGKEGCTPLR